MRFNVFHARSKNRRQCVGRVEQTGRGVRRFHDTFRAGCARFNDMPPGIISTPILPPSLPLCMTVNASDTHGN